MKPGNRQGPAAGIGPRSLSVLEAADAGGARRFPM